MLEHPVEAHCSLELGLCRLLKLIIILLSLTPRLQRVQLRAAKSIHNQILMLHERLLP